MKLMCIVICIYKPQEIFGSYDYTAETRKFYRPIYNNQPQRKKEKKKSRYNYVYSVKFELCVPEKQMAFCNEL